MTNIPELTNQVANEITFWGKFAIHSALSEAWHAGYLEGLEAPQRPAPPAPAVNTVGDVLLKLAGWIDSAQLPLDDEHHRHEALTRRRLAEILRETSMRPFARESVLDAVNETEGFGE